MSQPRRNQKGQALLETCISLSLVMSVLVLGGHVLASEWNRFKCAYTAFEKARRTLESEADNESHDDNGVTATAVCGGIKEQVWLPWLSEMPK